MLTPAQERQELLNWMRKAVDYFDSEAESAPTADDPASLYSEGRVVLRRLEKLTTFRPDEPQGDICKYCGWNRDEHAFGICPVTVVKTADVDNKDVVGTVCPTHETVLVDGLCKACGGKSGRNRRVAARWDELSAAGKHGHYETLFQIVREEVHLLEEANEEMIRGMADMAARFTARMDAAGEQIDSLRNSLLEMHACYMEAGSGEPLNKQQRHRHRMALMAAQTVLKGEKSDV